MRSAEDECTLSRDRVDGKTVRLAISDASAVVRAGIDPGTRNELLTG